MVGAASSRRPNFSRAMQRMNSASRSGLSAGESAFGRKTALQASRQLAEEFRAYSQRGGQVFISTHSPDFLNGCTLEEIFVLVKQGGYTKIHRAKDDERLGRLFAAGDLAGALWKQKLFQGADPA